MLRFGHAEEFWEVLGIAFLQLRAGCDKFLEAHAAVVVLVTTENHIGYLMVKVATCTKSRSHLLQKSKQFCVRQVLVGQCAVLGRFLRVDCLKEIGYVSHLGLSESAIWLRGRAHW